MRTKLLCLALAGICLLGASCAKDDSVDPSNPNTNVPDPEGTVSLSMRNRNNGGTSMPGTYIYIDRSDNFVNGGSGDECVSIGRVNGLGNVTYIPKMGWASSVAVVPGEGYIVYTSATRRFYRIYVMSYTSNILNEVIGAEVKYQTPFYGSDEAISIPNDSKKITFEGGGGVKEIPFLNKGLVFCQVEATGCTASGLGLGNIPGPIQGIIITAAPNMTTETINGKVTLTAQNGKKTEINVTIKGLETFALSEKTLNFDRTESTLTATVMPSDWKITVKSNAEWCSCRIVSNVIEVKLQANTTSKNRSTIVTVNVEGFSDPQTIDIHQNRYAPGDYYNEDGNEGVVFVATGLIGKIISMDEGEAQWSTENIETGAKDMDNGMNNQNIIRKLANWNTKYPAFGWCNSKGEGWYLPAKNELSILSNKDIGILINATLSTKGGTLLSYNFWSSSEASSTTAYNNYNTVGLEKHRTLNIRAVRAF